MRYKPKPIAIVVIALFMIGCIGTHDSTSTPSTSNESTVLKVKVFLDGKVFANDQSVDIDQLAKLMSSLKKPDGVVWYYRESSDGEPHPNAIEVMRLVVENQLPISLSTKPDYSDVVGPDGVPRPR
jgi:biopolymer transport protein ExbD